MPKRLLLALLVALYPAAGYGQATVIQGGSWTSGLIPMYSGSGITQPVVQQSATAAGGAQSIKELSLVARGIGTAPFVGSGGGYLGSIFCLYDGPTSGQHHQLCLSPNATGSKGLLSYNAGGGASAQSLVFNINGSEYEFPAIVGGVAGPVSSTVGNVATWNNTSGTLLADGGAPIGTSGAAIPLLNGTNTWSGTQTFNSTRLVLAGSGSGVTVLDASAAASGTITVPAATDTLVGKATTDTLTNKTLTAPVIASISNSGTITIPTGTDTLVGKATTDVFTNKTFNTAGTGNVFQIAGQGITAVTGANATVLTGGTQITDSLGANVSLSNTGLYFDGPSIAQGSSGTWFASGTVSLVDTAGAANFKCKLWDGTTVIAANTTNSTGINAYTLISLSGYLASPAGNIRISCNDATSTSGVIGANATSLGNKDSTISAFRIN